MWKHLLLSDVTSITFSTYYILKYMERLNRTCIFNTSIDGIGKNTLQIIRFYSWNLWLYSHLKFQYWQCYIYRVSEWQDIFIDFPTKKTIFWALQNIKVEISSYKLILFSIFNYLQYIYKFYNTLKKVDCSKIYIMNYDSKSLVDFIRTYY